MHPLDETDLPHPPEIIIDVLRAALADLPGAWRLIVDDSHRLLLLDEQGDPRGYIDVADGRLVLLSLTLLGDIA